MRRATAFVVGALALAACDKPAEPGASKEPAAASQAAGAKHETTGAAAAPADVAFEKPAAWQDAPSPSRMRKASWRVPKADGDPEDAEVSVVQAGGTVDMNVERWEAQFEGKPKAKRTARDVNGLHVTIVELRGTFTGSGMPGQAAGAPKPGWALVGAIVPTRTPTFIKMTGPEKTVEAARHDFDALVGGLKPR
ncbi:MAG TPA: hypothetical protein VHB21_19325 [Minicystis sp.]|nr:hypothetical protein [Minicystis sp.]